MTYLFCPNCGNKIEIDSVGEFTVRWSSKKCDNCGSELSIRCDSEARFVRYSKKPKVQPKIQALA